MIVKFQKSKISSYVINQMFNIHVFCDLKLCIKNKFIGHIVNNVWFEKKKIDIYVKNIKNMQSND